MWCVGGDRGRYKGVLGASAVTTRASPAVPRIPGRGSAARGTCPQSHTRRPRPCPLPGACSPGWRRTRRRCRYRLCPSGEAGGHTKSFAGQGGEGWGRRGGEGGVRACGHPGPSHSCCTGVGTRHRAACAPGQDRSPVGSRHTRPPHRLGPRHPETPGLAPVHTKGSGVVVWMGGGWGGGARVWGGGGGGRPSRVWQEDPRRNELELRVSEELTDKMHEERCSQTTPHRCVHVGNQGTVVKYVTEGVAVAVPAEEPAVDLRDAHTNGPGRLREN